MKDAAKIGLSACFLSAMTATMGHYWVDLAFMAIYAISVIGGIAIAMVFMDE